MLGQPVRQPAFAVVVEIGIERVALWRPIYIVHGSTASAGAGSG